MYGNGNNFSCRGDGGSEGGYSIYTQADSLEELKEMVRDAVECHFEEKGRSRIIRLHIVRQEVITI